jgi:osmotically-inducible protein OsmY
MSLHLSSPPGFERSPDSLDLQEELQAQALCHHLFRNRSIDLSATHGVVILQGEVQSYYEKQLDQEVVRRIVGVERVENQIEVAYD